MYLVWWKSKRGVLFCADFTWIYSFIKSKINKNCKKTFESSIADCGGLDTVNKILLQGHR